MYSKASYLIHFGIKGQQWGVRRFQNEDGTLTEEGRRRYLNLDDRQTVQRINDIVNKTADTFNKKHLLAINKKYDDRYGKGYDLTKDDKANMEYTRDMIDAWKSTYREVLAKDLGTDPKSLEGQKWLNELFAYRTNLDKEYEDLAKKNKPKEESKQKEANASTKTAKTEKAVKSKTNINMNPKPLKDYSNSKMSQSKAINQAYDDLEKIYPNFSSFSQSQQDTLWLNYLNESGLYKWL